LIGEITDELIAKHGLHSELIRENVNFIVFGDGYFGLVETKDNHFFIDIENDIPNINIYGGEEKAKALFNDFKLLRG